MPDPLQEAYNDVMEVLAGEAEGLTLQQLLERLGPERRSARHYSEAEVRAIYWWLREQNQTRSRTEGTVVHA